MPYDPVAQLRVISLISTSPYVLIVRADSPARDIAGFHAMVRERGNKLNYGSSGSGTPLHLGGELYKLMMGVDLTHVAYRGSGPAITALIAGEVDMVFADVPGASGQIRAGTVRPLATMVQQRIPQLPNVPTMAESDPRLRDYDVYTWAMLVAPKATPDRAIQRLHDVAIAAARQPDVMKRFEEMGFDYVGSSPADGDKRLEAERDKWRDVIKRANIKVDL
jgi:tripartite-type tricarboxylate transporter receptor subunit TctC